jgi:hypothetical protein
VSAHRTVLVYRVGKGWWARCQLCGWVSEVDREIAEVRTAGRAHEAEPEVDWSIPASWLQGR